MKCWICRRDLKATESIARGLGRECASKFQEYLNASGVADAELAEMEAIDDLLMQRRLGTFYRSLGSADAPRIWAIVQRTARIREANRLGLTDAQYFEFVDGVPRAGCSEAVVPTHWALHPAGNLNNE